MVATAAGSTRVASGTIDQSGSESQDSDTETTTSQTELASEAIFRREFCKSLFGLFPIASYRAPHRNQLPNRQSQNDAERKGHFDDAVSVGIHRSFPELLGALKAFENFQDTDELQAEFPTRPSSEFDLFRRRGMVRDGFEQEFRGRKR